MGVLVVSLECVDVWVIVSVGCGWLRVCGGGSECVGVVVNVRVWGYGWLSVGMWVVVNV